MKPCISRNMSICGTKMRLSSYYVLKVWFVFPWKQFNLEHLYICMDTMISERFLRVQQHGIVDKLFLV